MLLLLLTDPACKPACKLFMLTPWFTKTSTDDAHTHTIQQVTITPGHATYEQLQNTTLPLWKDIYFFNLTNPEDFQSGKMPELKEIGPYSYRWVFGLFVCCLYCFSLTISPYSVTHRESRTKQFHGYSAGGTLLNYTQTKLFHFDSTHSGKGLKENDTICTINLPLVVSLSVCIQQSTVCVGRRGGEGLCSSLCASLV